LNPTLPFGTLLRRFVIAEPLAGPPKLSSNLVRSDVSDTTTFVCWSLCMSRSDFVGVTISRPPALSVNVTSRQSRQCVSVKYKFVSQVGAYKQVPSELINTLLSTPRVLKSVGRTSAKCEVQFSQFRHSIVHKNTYLQETTEFIADKR